MDNLGRDAEGVTMATYVHMGSDGGSASLC